MNNAFHNNFIYMYIVLLYIMFVYRHSYAMLLIDHALTLLIYCELNFHALWLSL